LRVESSDTTESISLICKSSAEAVASSVVELSASGLSFVGASERFGVSSWGFSGMSWSDREDAEPEESKGEPTAALLG
jgi:hypothetical protein